MFYFSAFLTLLLVAFISWRAYHRNDFVFDVFAACGFLIFFSFCLSPFNILIAGGVATVSMAWWFTARQYPSLCAVYCLLTVATIYGWQAWGVIDDVAQLRQHFVETSMEDRAPPAKPEYTTRILNDKSAKRLDALKQEIQERVGENTRLSRITPEMIEELHNDTVNEFINTPGFGFARMRNNPNRIAQYVHREQKREPVPFADTTDDSPLSAASTQPGVQYSISETLDGMHTQGVLDFVNPLGFGLFQDRKRVIGFGSHGFSRTPNAGGWQIRTVELVGLMKHEQPVVYISKNLPRMDELVKAPTRPLDALEAHGLAKLVAGEDYYATNTPDGLRMVGAIRSVEQCQKCHGGGQGDLLGAFSYRLAATK